MTLEELVSQLGMALGILILVLRLCCQRQKKLEEREREFKEALEFSRAEIEEDQKRHLLELEWLVAESEGRVIDITPNNLPVPRNNIRHIPWI